LNELRILSDCGCEQLQTFLNVFLQQQTNLFELHNYDHSVENLRRQFMFVKKSLKTRKTGAVQKDQRSRTVPVHEEFTGQSSKRYLLFSMVGS